MRVRYYYVSSMSASFGSLWDYYQLGREPSPFLTPGKKKDKWEERVFTLTKKGLSWCAALRCSPRWNRLARYQHFAQTVVSQCKRRGTNASDRSCAVCTQGW